VRYVKALGRIADLLNKPNASLANASAIASAALDGEA
jgi:hypothetical protein